MTPSKIAVIDSLQILTDKTLKENLAQYLLKDTLFFIFWIDQGTYSLKYGHKE